MSEKKIDESASVSHPRESTCSHGSDCWLCGPGGPYEADPERPCASCGEIIGHGAHQLICDKCGKECCTSCSGDGHDNAVLCDECDPANVPGVPTGRMRACTRSGPECGPAGCSRRGLRGETNLLDEVSPARSRDAQASREPGGEGRDGVAYLSTTLFNLRIRFEKVEGENHENKERRND